MKLCVDFHVKKSIGLRTNVDIGYSTFARRDSRAHISLELFPSMSIPGLRTFQIIGHILLPPQDTLIQEVYS